MKRIVIISLVSIMFTGCASTMQQAQTDCQSAGFKPGTDLFLQCLNQQSKPGFLQQYMLKRATNPPAPYQPAVAPQTTTCRQVGSSMVCNTF